MRCNTAHRLRLTLQGGCSTPRLIPPGRGDFIPCTPDPCPFAPARRCRFLSDKGHLGRALSALPSRPSHRPAFLPAGRKRQHPSALQRGAFRAPLLDTPSTSPPYPRQASPGSPPHDDMPTPLGGCHRSNAMPDRRRTPDRIAAHTTGRPSGKGRAARSGLPATFPPAFPVPRVTHRSPAPLPSPLPPSHTRSLVLRSTSFLLLALRSQGMKVSEAVRSSEG